ncbi:MAG: DNA primase [Desulfobacula sp.]|jgi:DNA primase
MHIPEEKISEILNTSDIVDIVSESVILKKTGTNYFGLCPFHSEKTPSFSVNSNKQIFHCFGCSAGGNVFSYLMKYHGISFPEAVKMTARKYNIELGNDTLSPSAKKEIEIKEVLFRINQSVMDYFHDFLKESSQAEDARNYLKKRGISESIIHEFKLGFSPEAWDTIVRLFHKNKISNKNAVQSGLILERKQKEGFYDRFRNRIIFPIFDINMQVAGFGGRVMDEGMPKYLNSPETPVYFKSRILYGLHTAKQFCRQEGFVYIVEGYFDFLSLYQQGIKNVVASLGTALTSDHVRILKGYATRMILVFDSDTAGINAAKRSIKIFLKEGVDIRILVLPDGNDPDSYMLKHGKESFIGLSEKAGTVMQFLLQVSIQTHGSSIEGRIKILDDMKQHLILIQDSALRSLYVKELAETLNIDEKAVLEKVREYYLDNTTSTLSFGKENENERESDRREEQIISMMLNHPETIPLVKNRDVVRYFYSEKLKHLANQILSVDYQNTAFINCIMTKMENNKDQELLASYAIKDFFLEEDIQKQALSLINRIIRVSIRQENTLKNEIISAEKGLDSELMNELLKKKHKENMQLYNR